MSNKIIIPNSVFENELGINFVNKKEIETLFLKCVLPLFEKNKLAPEQFPTILFSLSFLDDAFSRIKEYKAFAMNNKERVLKIKNDSLQEKIDLLSRSIFDLETLMGQEEGVFNSVKIKSKIIELELELNKTKKEKKIFEELKNAQFLEYNINDDEFTFGALKQLNLLNNMVFKTLRNIGLSISQIKDLANDDLLEDLFGGDMIED